MNKPDKKLAIVTGAARGIGLATAYLFNEKGYRVAVVDNDNQIIGSINPIKIINTVFGGRKNNN